MNYIAHIRNIYNDVKENTILVIIAAKTGIKVSATGGIGGVHRDFNNFFDVSRDLREIAESDVFISSALNNGSSRTALT